MPTYAYRCADCGHAFDVYQSFSDEALQVCPECSGKLRKVFGSLGVTFNGSGFYRTDSRSSASSGSSGSSASGGSTTGASSSSGGSGSGASSSAGAASGGSGSSTA
ncbi:FmdB family zinc ribbon protein [Leucobacter triazinivorans]|uniref:FmdB family transcriptional regulator n=1 Tax=Leucobacter triazinivorans TaxID=1784719 RepID=A0A4P6KG92_9MICO|nr:FmdB family zinc ribbon protein [Leucobacter triazinivorans]QBE49515.1 FmdB family transcriptional regulator [Leucobacter triazinivorans]